MYDGEGRVEQGPEMGFGYVNMGSSSERTGEAKILKPPLLKLGSIVT